VSPFHQDFFVPRACCARKAGEMPRVVEPGKPQDSWNPAAFIGDIPGRVSINDDAVNYP
jgi:hypothetical protein